MGGIEKFTEEEEEFVREMLGVRRKVYVRKIDSAVTIMALGGSKIIVSGWEDMLVELREILLLVNTLMDEPSLVFETKSEFAIGMMLVSCDVKKLVGFKRQICLSILRKLDKEMAVVNKTGEKKLAKNVNTEMKSYKGFKDAMVERKSRM